MHPKRRLIVLALILLFSFSAVAQIDEANEVGLLLGAEIVPQRATAAGPPVDFGKGIAFSANYARRLTSGQPALFLEFPFVAVPNHDVRTNDPNFITALATLYVTPSLRANFAHDAMISPWLSAGFGYGLYEASKLFADGSPNTRRDVHSGTAQFGGGVDVRTGISILVPISLRGEVRDFYTLRSPPFGSPVRGAGQHNVVLSGGFVLHF
jgi:hypothetical protein